VIGGPHYAGILIELIGIHFGGDVTFMIGELPVFARRKTWDCLGTLRDASILPPSVISVRLFLYETSPLEIIRR